MPSISEIQSFLDIDIHTQEVDYQVLETRQVDTYQRQLISYRGTEGDEIRAFLFLPDGPIKGSVLVHHQHHGQRHLGKSEVAGLAGDPFQFFCPKLAAEGFICLAPDSICFEDRRSNKQGIVPDEDPDVDHLQHYNAMAYRLLQGSSLMKTVIEDSSIAISLLEQLPASKPDKIGILGHSYGGNTVIFHSPFDKRISYSCSSGAVCSFRNKIQNQTGIELAEVLPGFAKQYDLEDLIKAVAPRNFVILSADQDKYSRDAAEVYRLSQEAFQAIRAEDALIHKAYRGGHGLTQERVDYIIEGFRQWGKEA